MRMDPENTTVEKGTRLADSEGFIGTVRYSGPVSGTKGSWLGVEWDDITRGKHDGTKDGIEYFKPRHPTAGSFLRIKKANFGVTCYTALCERYGTKHDEHAGVKTDELYVKGGGGQVTTVEIVGANKVNKQQSKLDSLTVVVLRGQLVHGNGEGSELTDYVPHIRDLDLSKNLLPSLDAVAKVTAQLTHLRILNLSENLILIPDTCIQRLKGSFHNITTLLVNKMELTSKEVIIFCEVCPHLTELHLCYNKITHLEGLLVSHLTHLQLLNLEGNHLTGWQEILTLGELPSLEKLILNQTNIDRIQFPSETQTTKTSMFVNLKSLSISDNKLTQWKDINELNKLQSLEELKIRNNPVLETNDPDSNRQIIMARIAQLTMCNGTQIAPVERKGAEIDYLKTNGIQWREHGGHDDPEKCQPSVDFINIHPRYQELVNKYGPPEESESKVQSSSLKHTLISVIIESDLGDRPAIKKKIPLTMTVQKVKALIQRLYRINVAELKISYESQWMAGYPIEFDNDLRQVGYYSIEDGDTVRVSW